MKASNVKGGLTMKRKLATVCAAVILTAAVAGCGSGEGAQTSAVQETDASLVGEWELVKSTLDDKNLDVSENRNVYVFGEDGAFEMAINGETMGVGTYTIDGDKVTFDLDGAKTEMVLDGNTLTTTSETPDGIVIQVHQRTDTIAVG